VSSLDITHYKEVVGHYVTGVVVITALSDGEPVVSRARRSTRSRSIPFSSPSRPRAPVPHGRASGLLTRWALTCCPSNRSSWLESCDERHQQVRRVRWTGAPHGSPLLEGALAHLEGQILSVTTHGDHDFAVVSIDFVQADAGSPLLYYRGDFGLPTDRTSVRFVL